MGPLLTLPKSAGAVSVTWMIQLLDVTSSMEATHSLRLSGIGMIG